MTVTSLNVSLDLGGNDVLSVGKLAAQNRRIFFEYDSEFLSVGLPISPFKLPLKSGVQVPKEMVFDGLFGVFNDSLPDGWGRLLLDRQLLRQGAEPGTLTPLDRLALIGSQAMGALRYEPETKSQQPEIQETLELDRLATAAEQELAGTPSDLLEQLIQLSGSSGGARPKILAYVSPDKTLVVQRKTAPQDYTPWLIKFRAGIDAPDSGAVEYAYSVMARTAVLEVPETYLFPSRTGPGYFGVRRFDRTASGSVHMHTASGLLHADHRFSSLDYDNLLKATMILTKDIQQVERMYRIAVFNVLAHNRDDHSKNFSYVMDRSGTWQVSPAYDLTFSSGPGGEHSMLVSGEGRSPNQDHLLQLASKVGIQRQTALNIISVTRSATSQWRSFAADAGVRSTTIKRIQKILTSR
ncbi:MAG: type II toxin-antitoxin system HipA family toxin [Anaerolineae bacterium]|nr:type II toxin-antitoxin system HipA family toxin [Gloeobacterales cyanobacterium ES-bin-313]